MVNFDKISLTDIVPVEYNPRKISDEDFEKLSNSIGEFGLVDPIIINLNNNCIIGGHQRYDVLLNQYMDDGLNSELNLIRLGDIGWVFTEDDLKVESEEHEKALNIALNKISGEWDFEKLNVVLDDLKEVEGFDVGLTGFDVDVLKLSNNDDVDWEKIYDDFKSVPKENKNKDKNDSINGDVDVKDNKNYYILVVCVDEDDMVETFDNLVEMGLECKMTNS